MAPSRIEPFVTPGLGDSSYLLASGDEAVVIDPQRDAGRFLAAAEANGWRIVAVLETHVHNDYVSGAHEIRAVTGAELCLPANGGYAFDHRRMAEGDRVRAGDLTVTAMETPGHTPEHLSWLVTSDGNEEPEAVFTGGSLMVGGAGRTDLLGPDLTQELTRAQFRSLARLAELPDGVRVLPTHGAGSFCGSSGGETRRTSSIGVERTTNDALGHPDVDAFVAGRLSGLQEYPAYYRHMAPINRAGVALVRNLDRPVALDPDGIDCAVVSGTRLVDARDRTEFARAHIEGSVNVELDEQFASYVGWVIPWNAPVAFVLPNPETASLEEAVVQLRRIGWDRIMGHLRGGVDAWRASGRDVRSYATATVAQLCASTAANRKPNILDVRQPSEWAEGAIPASRTIFIGDLPGRLGEIPSDEETWIVCRTGHRSAIAASLLDAAGTPVRLVTPGGVPEWIEACGHASVR